MTLRVVDDDSIESHLPPRFHECEGFLPRDMPHAEGKIVRFAALDEFSAAVYEFPFVVEKVVVRIFYLSVAFVIRFDPVAKAFALHVVALAPGRKQVPFAT